MRKFMAFAFIAQLITIVVSAQDDMGKLEKEFEKMMKNTTGIPYGDNKVIGKYYDIRGFKMYC